jgi:hypothetical protein
MKRTQHAKESSGHDFKHWFRNNEVSPAAHTDLPKTVCRVSCRNHLLQRSFDVCPEVDNGDGVKSHGLKQTFLTYRAMEINVRYLCVSLTHCANALSTYARSFGGQPVAPASVPEAQNNSSASTDHCLPLLRPPCGQRTGTSSCATTRV